ncbi:hypothetical protein [Shouchella patagoniensis]|uniref:hypothetical protein n=1 Tax=Shouchella patagoniensis TaxID=228576 RepID=UPI000994C483|nr:hypothetical protein [Shouchella patagoniensis]
MKRQYSNSLSYRNAEANDSEALTAFTKNEFGERWLPSIRSGFSKIEIPIFLARKNDEIIGFACFDVVRNEKGLFGPMGTAETNRVKGGYAIRTLSMIGRKRIVV